MDKARHTIPVVQWLHSLLSLPLAELSGICKLEEGWCKLHQPLGVNGRSLPHVFLGGKDELMVDHPKHG